MSDIENHQVIGPVAPEGKPGPDVALCVVGGDDDEGKVPAEHFCLYCHDGYCGDHRKEFVRYGEMIDVSLPGQPVMFCSPDCLRKYVAAAQNPKRRVR